MTNNDFLSGISWHLECMVLAATEIDNFRSPTNQFQLRMHYSLYLTNLMSAIEMVNEVHPKIFDAKLKDSLRTSSCSGANVLNYLRELRNGIVHRGIDPTSGSAVIDSVVCAIAPPKVKKRNGKCSYSAPAGLLRDIFVHCDISAKPIIGHFVEQNIEELVSLKPQRLLSNALAAIDAVPHMPDWAKEMAKENTKPWMLLAAQTGQIKKFRGLLKPWPGQRIA